MAAKYELEIGASNTRKYKGFTLAEVKRHLTRVVDGARVSLDHVPSNTEVAHGTAIEVSQAITFAEEVGGWMNYPGDGILDL